MLTKGVGYNVVQGVLVYNLERQNKDPVVFKCSNAPYVTMAIVVGDVSGLSLLEYLHCDEVTFFSQH